MSATFFALDLFYLMLRARTLSLLSLSDGYCLASIHADDLPRLSPPHEYKSADSVAGSWDWVNLSMAPYVEVSFIRNNLAQQLPTTSP